jgi:hypothetical protein
MKTLMVVVLLAVLGALGSAGYFMLKRNPEGEPGSASSRDRRMAHALAVRVGLCVALFIVILFSWAMGWVRPGGLPVAA